MTDMTESLAQKHGVSPDAVRVLQDALRRGGGRQAQFSHKDLGGMGQWSAGGMIQVGDMFNTALKDRVNALCTELSQQAADAPAPAGHSDPSNGSGDWWPCGLGRPSASGAQNGMRYACFPDSRRVAIEQSGAVTVYDSGDHRISGVSQQQSGTQELTFSSQKGTIRASDLPVVDG
jgi:hypothetical protein